VLRAGRCCTAGWRGARRRSLESGAGPAGLPLRPGGSPERAVIHLERAGDHPGASGPTARGGRLREALDRLDGLGRCPGCAAGAREVGEVLQRTGRYDAAWECWSPRDATRGRRPGGPGRATATRWRHMGCGAPPTRASRACSRSGQLERGAASPSLAALYLRLENCLIAGGRYEVPGRGRTSGCASPRGGDPGTLGARRTEPREHPATAGRLGEARRQTTNSCRWTKR